MYILPGSVRRTLCLDVWDTFLRAIGCVPSQASAPPNNPQNTPILDDEQVLAVYKHFFCKTHL